MSYETDELEDEDEDIYSDNDSTCRMTRLSAVQQIMEATLERLASIEQNVAQLKKEATMIKAEKRGHTAITAISFSALILIALFLFKVCYLEEK